ncbi:ATP-binding protein [Sediminispirochaeta smaragdinae]|jgi:anti-sigma regulatory factor (Ser/Thr protein kinase)|uniref:Histidine kinase/HSP90-like ATPase domain-containing protein n=1 Tax=Sediminispirochaeta smaragdinae (strain DSM 11293 / JCM 15392 / SEBR 4228) TaxID=573413 RepID=E1R1T6_SEDSS|nr:ATP-binding protein [Sediminispirochaeta smaragdinae]ADK81462.1 hypothetical protein Spirs_2347 [Sediminispirochaeta smaragdinae DSM 11293]
MSYISYKGKKYRQVKFTFSTKAPFEKILETLNQISFNGSFRSDEQAIYAILELVSNSLRAHREKAVKEKIVLRIQGEKGRTLVRLRDLGGGFDISKLPYDITQPVNEIDTISDAFEAYRQKNNYRRFGMGILLARKVFPGFRLTFDERNGTIAGTIVDLSDKVFDTVGTRSPAGGAL